MFGERDGIRWAVFGEGSLTINAVLNEEVDPVHVEVQLREPPASMGVGAIATKVNIEAFPANTVLAFRNVESIDVMIGQLRQAREKLAEWLSRSEEKDGK